MASPQQVTPGQLRQARIARWHHDGSALHTLGSAREWLAEAGLVPYLPHAQFNTPSPSFAEAVLGRPQNGWRKPLASGDNSGESNAQSSAETEIETETEIEVGTKGEDADLAATDPEIMLSDDDEFHEDEGDEIAEEDRLHAAFEQSAGEQAAAGQTAAGEEAKFGPAYTVVDGFSAEELTTVRQMLARLVAEGSAVPLNLLGSTTGEPDYLCSPQAFSFVYTLRGDKTWKQEPAQTGSMRVSPLAVKVYAALKEHGESAAAQLVQHLGQGVVQSAVLRALSELWAIQRAMPLPDADGGDTRWELLTGRFVRHIKAGANAGQPTALSALLSLYLGQVIAATEEEMEIFLSPLVARSRVRDVVHGLAASQQLDAFVMEGKRYLHVSGDLPEFAAEAEAVESAAPAAPARSRYEADDRRAAIEARARRAPAAEGERRERRPAREGAERGAGRGPSRASERGDRKPYERKPYRPAVDGERGERAPRTEGGADRPARREGTTGGRQRGSFAGGTRPAYRRDDGSASRPRPEFRERREGYSAAGDERPRRSFPRSPDRPSYARPERPSYARPDRPSYARPDDDRPQRPSREPRDGAENLPARRTYDSSDGGPASRGARSAAGGGYKARGSFGAARAERGEGRGEPRREGGGERSRERSGGFGRGPASDRPYGKRTEGADRSSGARPPRPFRPREEAARGPGRDFGDRGDRFAGPRGASRGGDARPRPQRRDEGGPARPPRFGAGSREARDGESRPFRPAGGRREEGGRPDARPPRRFAPRDEGDARRGGPGRPFAGGPRPGGRPSGGSRPAGAGGSRPPRSGGSGVAGGPRRGGGPRPAAGGSRPRAPRKPAE